MIAYFDIVPVHTTIHRLNRTTKKKVTSEQKKPFCIRNKLTKESVASHYYYYYLFSICFQLLSAPPFLMNHIVH